MLKHLLPGALLLATPPALAQTAPSPAPAPSAFCVVRSYGLLNDNRPSFTLDAGTPAKEAAEPALSQAFKSENLRSAADMLTYMHRRGWELLHTTAVAGAWPAGAVPNVEYQYIFRRKAS